MSVHFCRRRDSVIFMRSRRLRAVYMVRLDFGSFLRATLWLDDGGLLDLFRIQEHTAV